MVHAKSSKLGEQLDGSPNVHTKATQSSTAVDLANCTLQPPRIDGSWGGKQMAGGFEESIRQKGTGSAAQS